MIWPANGPLASRAMRRCSKVRLSTGGADDGGADDGNRTRMTSLEGWGSTIELHPRDVPARVPATSQVAYRLAARSRTRWRACRRKRPVMIQNECVVPRSGERCAAGQVRGSAGCPACRWVQVGRVIRCPCREARMTRCPSVGQMSEVVAQIGHCPLPACSGVAPRGRERAPRSGSRLPRPHGGHYC